MIRVCKEFEFHAAHLLPHHLGACQNLHGHTYKLKVCVEGLTKKEGASQGMIVDFSDLKRIVNAHIVTPLDHADLNVQFKNPTAELMLKWIKETLCEVFETELPGIRPTEIVLWETPTSSAVWEAD